MEVLMHLTPEPEGLLTGQTVTTIAIAHVITRLVLMRVTIVAWSRRT